MKRQATMRQHGRLMALLWYVALPGKWRTRLDLGAITLVHVVLGGSAHTLCQLRAHEQEHVRQYEVQARALCEQRRADSQCAPQGARPMPTSS